MPIITESETINGHQNFEDIIYGETGSSATRDLTTTKEKSQVYNGDTHRHHLNQAIKVTTTSNWNKLMSCAPWLRCPEQRIYSILALSS